MDLILKILLIVIAYLFIGIANVLGIVYLDWSLGNDNTNAPTIDVAGHLFFWPVTIWVTIFFFLKKFINSVFDITFRDLVMWPVIKFTNFLNNTKDKASK